MNLRYLGLFLSTFLVKFKGLIFVGVVTGLALFLLITFLSRILLPRSVERSGITGKYRIEKIPNDILSMVGDGLTRLDTDGKPQPALAKSWEPDKEGKNWTFNLDTERVWQDGKRVTSYDITYEFSDLTIGRPDDATVVFTLQNPFSPFPTVVSKPIFRKGLLGTGEWKATNISVSGEYIEKLTLENRNRDRRIYKFYPTEESAKLGFKMGEIDRLINIFEPSPFESWRNAEVSAFIERDKIVAVFFNNQDKFLSEKSLRQALSYSIAKDELKEDRAISPISPDSWAFNPQVKSYAYDPKRAKELIDDLRGVIKEGLSIKLSTSPALLSQAEKIVKDWNEVGVDASVQVVTGVPQEYQAILAIFDIPSDPDQYSVWHSTQTATNFSKYQSPRIDKLLEDGRSELDFDSRRKIYLDFQRFLVEDAPAAFLYHPVSYRIDRR